VRFDTYVRGPRRRQAEPSRCQRRRPARFASSSVNGPRERTFGTFGVPNLPRITQPAHRDNPAC
jgi:hypothetical protein